jgi:hypothetical protein
MFERYHEQLLSRPRFALRMLVFFAAAVGIDLLAVALGAVGYHGLEGFSWTDAFVNAAMIITGNGPIHELKTTGGKLFAAGDALVGEGIYVTVIAVMLAPIVHRLFHSFHLEIPEQNIGES